MTSLDKPLPRFAENRARREAINRHGKRWSAAHDLYCYRRFFEWQLIDASQYATATEIIKDRINAAAAKQQPRRRASNLPDNRMW